MNILVTSLALGSLYCLISACVIFNYSYGKFLNISILAYIALAPYVVGWIAGDDPSYIFFAVSCVITMVIISALAYAVDRLVFQQLEILTPAARVIASTCVLFIVLTFVSVVWPSGELVNNPLGINSFSLGGTQVLWIDIVSVTSALILLVAVGYFLTSTDMGHRVRALSADRDVAQAYGISRSGVSISVNVITGILCTVTGVLLASPGSPRSGVISVLFFALVALCGVIVARHRDVRICIIASFVIAFAQTWSAAHVNEFDAFVADIMQALGMSTTITLGPTFADRFVPFALALLALIVIPSKWVKEDVHD
jgi:branched-chain amino acid transport system permease protein